LINGNTANCALAALRSRGGIVQSLLIACNCRQISFTAASSFGKCPRVPTEHCSWLFRLSMELLLSTFCGPRRVREEKGRRAHVCAPHCRDGGKSLIPELVFEFLQRRRCVFCVIGVVDGFEL